MKNTYGAFRSISNRESIHFVTLNYSNKIIGNVILSANNFKDCYLGDYTFANENFLI